MNNYKRPRLLSIAVNDQQQYLMGHKRGWEDAQKQIAELEGALDKLKDTALDCIDFVGRANYTDRIIEARRNLREKVKQLKEQGGAE